MVCSRAWCITIWLSIFFCVFNWSKCTEFDYDGEDAAEAMLRKEAAFHIRGLSNAIKRLESSARRLHKRDTRKLTFDFDSSSTLGDICSRLFSKSPTVTDDSTPHASVSSNNNLTETVAENVDFKGKDHPSRWATPELYILSVKELRDIAGNKIQFIFNVAHTTQAFVMRLYSSENVRKTIIGPPGKYPGNPVTSTVRMSADISKCPDVHHAEFAFGLISNKSLTVRTMIDICKSRSAMVPSVLPTPCVINVNDKDNTKVTEATPSSEFRIVSFSSHSIIRKSEIIITLGETTEFLIDVLCSSRRKRFEIEANLWDWENETMKVERLILDQTREDNVPVHGHDRLLSYSIMSRTVLNESWSKDSYVFRTKLAVDTRSGQISGKIKLKMHGNVDPYDFALKPVDFIGTNREVSLRLPHKISAIPENYIQLHTSDKHECGNDWIEGSKNSTCVVNCYAEGSSIRSIYIIKKSSYIAPVASASSIFNGVEAFGMIDMGLATLEKDGEYQCVAVSDGGHVEQIDTVLVTHGFPFIHSTEVEDFENGTTIITCQVSGFEHLVVFLDFLYQRGRNSGITFDLTSEKVGNRTIVSSRFNTEDLYFPVLYAQCNARNDLGTHTNQVKLSSFIKSYNYSAPIVLKEEFHLTVLANGTARVFCTATGGPTVLISIESIGQHGRFVVAKKSNVFWSESEMRDRKSVVLDVPTRHLTSLDSSPKIFCLASNERGRTSEMMDPDNIVYVS